MPGQSDAVSFILCDGPVETRGLIAHSPFRLGRSPDQDLIIAHPYVSRQHAVITLEDGRYYLADQGSRHGTFLNGKRIQHELLAPGDSVQLGASDGPLLRFGERGTGSGSTINEILDQLPAINASNSGLEKLRWFFESARKLNTHGAVDQILAVLLETTLQLTEVERGYVFLAEESGQLQLALGRGRGGEVLRDEASLSRSAMEKATRTASEYIVTDTLSEEAVARSESIVAHNIRTVICIPLRRRRSHAGAFHGEMLGLLYLDSRLRPGSFTHVDSELLRTIATEAAALIDNAQLAVAEENERRYRDELKIAAEIQQGLMAVKLPTLPYASVAARSVPCKEVGGDFFDVVADEESLSVVIADVSGKGISAAILASTLQGMIYAQLIARQPLESIAEVVNKYICVKNIGKYATLLILRLTPGGMLEYINCGHIAPLVCTVGESLRMMEGNLPVGLIAQACFSAARVQLPRGARILLATDGVTEAEDSAGEFYGEDRLRRAIVHCATLEEVYRNIQAFCGAVASNDDCTLVELTYHG